MDKQSYMDESEKNPDKKPVEPGTEKEQQDDLPRADPGLKQGYNEKNPTAPQGSFTPESQADEPKEINQGDESK